MILEASEIQELKTFTSRFSFSSVQEKTENIFCNCGEKFTIGGETIEGINDEKTVQANSNYDSFISEFEQVFGDVKRALQGGATCTSCGTNYLVPENKRKLFYVDNYFVSGFFMKENDGEINLYHWKAKAVVNNQSSYMESDEVVVENITEGNEEEIGFEIKYKQIQVSKEDQKVFYKSFEEDDKQEVQVQDVFRCVTTFFGSDIKLLFGIHNLHIFLNNLSNIVVDTESIDIIGDMLSNIEMGAGIEQISQALIVFLAIISYSNLSTIAMTKGAPFLYELLRECDIPTAEELKAAGATKPVKIFNELTKGYVERLNEYIDADNLERHDFVYKSKTVMEEVDRIIYDAEGEEKVVKDLVVKEGEKEKEITLKVRNQAELDRNSENTRLRMAHKGMRKENEDGEGITVMQVIEDGSISKSIYKRIRNFSDYQSVLKYLKFYDKHELINILNKYDLDMLKVLIEEDTGIYFREKMTMKELDQVIKIVTTFAQSKSRDVYYLQSNADLSLKIGDIPINWNFIRDFDWAYYDDALLMIEEFGQMLKDDPDQAKIYNRKRFFDKIKNFDELKKYHDNLVTRYAFIKKEYGGESPFTQFTSKFLHLETNPKYKGPIKIKILTDVQSFIAEGEEMGHSAGNYGNKVSQGYYLVAKLVDESPNVPHGEHTRFTIGFNYNEYSGLEFHQLKSFRNQLATDRVKVLVMQWMTQNDVSYKALNDIKLRGDGTAEGMDISALTIDG